MKVRIKDSKITFFTSNILYILFFAFILRIVLSFFGTLQLDQGTFIAWSLNLARNGLKSFYNSWSDYLPGYLYFLWALGKINLLGYIPPVLLYKLPAILSDLATGYLIYKILEKHKNKKWGLLGVLIYIFNPAIIANSTFWGQVDSLTALALMLSLYFSEGNFLASSIFLAVGTLIKPQAAFVLPVILFLFIKQKRKFYEFLLYCLTGLTIFILGFVPFSNGNLIKFIFTRLNISANQYPYLSVNAFNFWGLFGFWKPEKIYFQISGYILVLISTVFLLIKSFKNKVSPYTLSAFIFASSFIFFTRMHERHLLPVFAPLSLASILNPIFLIPYLGFSIIYILNLIYSYQWITNNFVQIYPDILIKFIEFSGIILIVYMFILILKNKQIGWSKIRFLMNRIFDKFKTKKEVVSKFNFPKIELPKNKARNILYVILGFAFITRIFNLGSPPTMYFDEVYHAFTAKVMMSADRAKAWEWWNTPPEGFAYEWTHPPLAKLGMVVGMSIFGENSFGWRVPGAILGTASVLLVYLLSRQIFKDEILGLFASGIFSLDGLPLVMSRIGMNDSYILFFVLLSIYLFLKEKDFSSAVSFGLALASKWSAIWAIPILFVLWTKRKNKFKPSIAWFLLLPFTVYLLSYLPMFITGHSLATWWGMQEQMWWYHTGLRATHSYSSPWWSWPFLIRPVYLYTTDEIAGMVSRIYLMGNPFVFWFGVASIISSAIYTYIEKNKNLGLIVFSYLIFFVPWAASPRIMFLYHYLPSIPFLSIAIAYILRRIPKLAYWIIPIFFLTFIYFYPHWIGLNVPLALDKSYYWIPSWR